MVVIYGYIVALLFDLHTTLGCFRVCRLLFSYINMLSVYRSCYWATIAKLCAAAHACSKSVKQTQSYSRENKHRQQHCCPSVSSNLQTHGSMWPHFATSLFFPIRKHRKAVFSYYGAVTCQEGDRRRSLRRALAQCREKCLQPEPEARPIKNTCPTTNPSAELIRAGWVTSVDTTATLKSQHLTLKILKYSVYESSWCT